MAPGRPLASAGAQHAALREQLVKAALLFTSLYTTNMLQALVDGTESSQVILIEGKLCSCVFKVGNRAV